MSDTSEFNEKRKRIVTAERAKLAAQRLINSHFKNPGEHARMSIPVNVDDDDIVIYDFIEQAESSTQQAPEPRMAIENMRCPNCGESVWSHGERCQPRDVQRKATASDALRSAVQEWEAPNTQFKGKRTRFMFEPRDIWIGVFWDTDKQYVYFFPIPMLGVRYYYGH